MGVIAAFSGKLLITLIQTPIFVLISSCIFLLLGLAMFDLIEVKLPNRLHNYIHTKSANLGNGRYFSAFILGVLSSFLLGPCVTPPLIIAISFIAKTGNVINGILGLYAISLGMGLPILILSTVGNKLLPKSGAWMNTIKHIMGIIIIALAIYLTYPLINLGNSFLSIGVLCFITALAFLLIKQFRSHDLELLIHKIMPILMIIIGLGFVILGSTNQPTTTSQLTITNQTGGGTVVSINDLDKILAASNKPIIIIVAAKWCSICRELEATTFRDKDLLDKFKQFTVIHFDMTDNQPDSTQLLKRYKLYGPPAIIILDRNKAQQDKITGYISGRDLIRRLTLINN
jgi:thiol:disulfide interchange protein DsbD